MVSMSKMCLLNTMPSGIEERDYKMEENKYRAYDAQNNKMIYYTWEDLIDAAVATGTCNHWISDNIRDLIRIAEYDYSERMRMLYTGKKDGNGKEIYAGDIIYKERLSPDDPAYGFYGDNGIVEYDNDMMGFVITIVDGNQILNIDNFVIIGNKYENPELIG